MDELGHHDQVPAQDQDGAGVARSAAVVGGGEERDEVTLREPLKAIHDTLVRADNHLEPVVLSESRGTRRESRVSEEDPKKN